MAFVKAMVIGTLFLAFAAQAAKVEVTPIQKVISLLGGLAEKVAAEGKKEAAQYDKFACFCKEQATEKQIAIEAAAAIIDLNGGSETRMSSQITGFSNGVGGLAKDISTRKAEITKKTQDRQKDHDDYIKEAYDVAQAIEDCEGAIKAVEDHLRKQKKTSSASFLQVKLEKHTAAATVLALLKDETQAPNLGYDATYSILASMKKFVQDFKEQAAKIDADEGRAKYLSDSAILAEQNEIAFSTKEMHQTQEQLNREAADLEASKEATAQATKDKTADEKFLKELTNGCEAKAALFRRRGEARTGELTAIATAITKLKEGAPPAKEALLGGVGHVVKRHTKAPISFLQISREAGQKAAAKKARSLLAEAVVTTDSTALRSLTIRMQVSGDHFVKVRKLVQDMIKKLEDDASKEQTKKGFCDKNIKAGASDRDKAQMAIEDATSQVAKKSAEAEQLREEIATATKQLAALAKALLEHAELRKEEKQNNENTIKVASDAAAGVDLALKVLNEFYNKAGLLQYTPKNAGADGKSVTDKAPKMVEGEYAGAQDDAKGLLGMLEVCKTDFERVKAKTKIEEENAVDESDEFKDETDESIEEKEEIKKEKEEKLVEVNAEITEQQDELAEAKAGSSSALESLDKLREVCDLDGESAANRNKQRLKEIESLKEAQDILDNWKDTSAE